MLTENNMIADDWNHLKLSLATSLEALIMLLGYPDKERIMSTLVIKNPAIEHNCVSASN